MSTRKNHLSLISRWLIYRDDKKFERWLQKTAPISKEQQAANSLPLTESKCDEAQFFKYWSCIGRQMASGFKRCECRSACISQETQPNTDLSVLIRREIDRLRYKSSSEES